MVKKYQIKDLKKVSKREIISLKDTEQNSARVSISRKKTRAKNNQKSINLKSLGRNHKGYWTGKPNPNLDSIRSAKDKNNFHLVPHERILHPANSKFASVVRIAVSGLIIVIIINLFNVFGNGQNFKNTLVSSASSGIDNLMEGVQQSKNMSLPLAEEQFGQAEGHFNQALEDISFLKTSSVLAGEQNMKSLESLLQAGKNISEAGKLFSDSAENLQSWPDLFIQANKDVVLGATNENLQSLNSEMESLTDALSRNLQNVNAAIEKLSQANQHLSQVNASLLPPPYNQTLPQIKETLHNLEGFLSELSEQFPAILELLGDRYPHRYLILLQNDTESRPTGGFIGSLMIVDINDGIITKADFHDVYKYDGQLHEDIEAPEDIAQITSQWRLRDSNYSPDFAISAEKAAWFLQKSKGPSVDTVIAINQSAIGDLVAEMGPLEVEGLEYPIDANNFQFMLGYLIESKELGADNPKVILGKTIQAFRKKILEAKDPRVLLALFSHEIKDNKILFYSRDTEVQALFEKMQLTPHQANIEEGEDYLQVVGTSIGGNKSDLYINQNLTHNTIINPIGEVTDELSVTRRHNWDSSEISRWNNILDKFGYGEIPPHLLSILGNSVNKTSIKVYVPLGAELENVVGLDSEEVITRHDAELQKTYFLFTMEVAPGEENTISLRYKLPQSLNLFPVDMYRFTAQKQITLVQTELKKDLSLAPGLTLLKNNQNDLGTPEKLRDEYKLRAVIVN
jgi:Protein of unknown function (DUF4012)